MAQRYNFGSEFKTSTAPLWFRLATGICRCPEKQPAFAIFTDKELVEIAKQEKPTKISVQKISGINSARADRYAERLLAMTEPSPNDSALF